MPLTWKLYVLMERKLGHRSLVFSELVTDRQNRDRTVSEVKEVPAGSACQAQRELGGCKQPLLATLLCCLLKQSREKDYHLTERESQTCTQFAQAKWGWGNHSNVEAERGK